MLVYIIYEYLYRYIRIRPSHCRSITVCAWLFPDWLALFLVKCNICPCLRQGQKLVSPSGRKLKARKHVWFSRFSTYVGTYVCFAIIVHCAVNYETFSRASVCVGLVTLATPTQTAAGNESRRSGKLETYVCILVGVMAFEGVSFWALPPANCIRKDAVIGCHKHVARQLSHWQVHRRSNRNKYYVYAASAREAKACRKHIYECGKPNTKK